MWSLATIASGLASGQWSLIMSRIVVCVGEASYATIAQRLQRESPFKRVVMATHTNGSSGYIPNDAGFEPVSYEVTASRLRPGCAEDSIVRGFMDLMAVR